MQTDTDTDTGFRVEHDTMGEVRVPADALWRAQTQRAVENFPISGRGMERSQIRALGLVKGAAARINARIGVLDEDLAAAIAAAADEVAAGAHDAQFPIDVFQTGSGTSSNMNANEVIATLATRASGLQVHPNDHVNASQSSNDVFPTTIHVAATESLTTDVIPALEHLAATLRRRAQDWVQVVKAGRTHLMDAVPITLGQEAGGWATQAESGCAVTPEAITRLVPTWMKNRIWRSTNPASVAPRTERKSHAQSVAACRATNSLQVPSPRFGPAMASVTW